MSLSVRHHGIAGNEQWTDPDDGWIYERDRVTGKYFLANLDQVKSGAMLAEFDAESGFTVSQWDDLSGNAHHLTQATAVNQGSLAVDFWHGYNAVRFVGDGTNDKFMATANITGLDTQSMSSFAVFVSKNTSARCGFNTPDGGAAQFGRGGLGGIGTAFTQDFSTLRILGANTKNSTNVVDCLEANWGANFASSGVKTDSFYKDGAAFNGSLSSTIRVNSTSTNGDFMYVLYMLFLEDGLESKKAKDVIKFLGRKYIGKTDID